MERLIRIDKNGTKYFENTTCPKCFGRGYIDCYAHVEGGVCFQCNGSGWYLTHRKVMTPEYEAKLQARRDARNAAKEAEFNAHIAEHYNALGLNENGHAFAVMGNNTFEHKDQLKALSARFNGVWWYFANPVEGWDTAEIDAVPYLEIDPLAGVCKWDEECKKYELRDAINAVLKERRTAANAATFSEFFGAVGDKVCAEVTLQRCFHFNSTDYTGNDCTMYGYTMRDNAGHCFVWVTGSCSPWKAFPGVEELQAHSGDYAWLKVLEGKQFTLKGTVKAHTEREGLKETRLNRCKFVFAA